MDKQIIKTGNQILLKDLIPDSTVGLPVLRKTIYEQKQFNFLVQELKRFSLARQETIPEEVIIEWIRTAQERNVSFSMLVAQIRMAKGAKKYGSSTLGDILESDTSDYHKHYWRGDDSKLGFNELPKI